jgi:epoxyqueuosine reductase
MTTVSVKDAARRCGFDLCGVASADDPPRLGFLREWIARGFAGSMGYLARSVDERTNPRLVLPTVRSVVSVGCVYNTPAPFSVAVDTPGVAVVSRYAWGDDYHDVLRVRLRRLLAWMRDEAGPGFEACSLVDAGPIQEKAFAAEAGLGWIGKHTCVISPTLGSWIVLGTILTNTGLDADAPAVDHCGTCTRCLDACPTGAIVEPYVLDARRCLSYLTIERRGDLDPAIRPAIAREVFGCDICQDVCPWNRRAAVTSDPAWQPRDGLAYGRLIDYCRLTDDAWRSLLRGSAMRRAGLRRIRESLALAAAHLPAGDRAEALDALASHPSGRTPSVAAAVGWARAPDPVA